MGTLSDFERTQLTPEDDAYPLALLETPRPPSPLYVAGDPSLLDYGLAVVGARRATPYGLSCARRFAGWAAEHGVTIISGAAHGCDQAAQRAALEVGGRTIAVLGCGADVDYPCSASDLLAVLRRDHAVVSELPWGSEARKRAFTPRNRIIAGLSAAVLIVEAAVRSGTYSTADHAIAASRDVLVVPGSIYAPECAGTNRLARQGATIITDVSEFADALRGVGLIPDTVDPGPGGFADPSDPLARALIANPMRPDDAARAFDRDIIEVMRRIGALEAAGLVTRYPDGRYGTKGG